MPATPARGEVVVQTALTEAVARIGKTPPEATHVIYHDVKRSDWAQGGVMASER